MPIRVTPTTVVKSDALVVQQLFSERFFLVPVHQRDYVWEEAQVRQLWSDLLAHHRRSTINDSLVRSPVAYFLGAMVVLQPNLTDEKRCEVIDGQQRLTTLTCIVAVLQEYLSATPADLQTEEVRGTLFQCQGMLAQPSGGQWSARLRLTDEQMNAFLSASCLTKRTRAERQSYWATDQAASSLLRTGQTLRSQKQSPAFRIKQAFEISYTEIDRFLEGTTGKQRVDRLLSLVAVLSECFVVLLIEAQDHSTAYDLFESLNYRGMALTQADLVKNEIVKRAANPDERETIVEKWAAIKEDMTSHEILLPEFLHYSYLSRFGFVKATALFSSAKSKVTDVGALTYVSGLGDDSDCFDSLLRGDASLWQPSTNQTLNDLREVLNLKLTYVALMAAHRLHKSDHTLFDSYVQTIVNFAFRYMKVMDGDNGGLLRAMQEGALKITSGSTPAQLGEYFKSWAPDAGFSERFERLSVANAKLAYYIVYQIECVKMQGLGTIPVEHGVEQHLEHIMPKTPRSTNWPEAEALKRDQLETFKDYVWRIGNLLPLPREINCSIRNKAIAEKIVRYNEPNLLSPKEVEGHLKDGKWTLDSITERQRALAPLALRAWTL